MDRLGLGLDMDEAQPQVPQNPAEARKQVIHKCIQYLLHACPCKDAQCKLPGCVKIKRILKHTRDCKLRQLGNCTVCKQFLILCYTHAKSCNEQSCPVPICARIKVNLREQRLQKRMRQERMRQASPHGEQEPSEEEEEKGTPSEEQESRGEEINKEPQQSMADLQDEQYIYVETRRPEPGPAVEEHVPPPPLIAPAPRQPPQPPAEPELPQPGEQLRRSTRNRHPPHWYGHIVVHSAHTRTNCEDTVSLDGELCNDGNSCTHEQHY